MRYARWIAEHAAGDVSGLCDPMTEAMAQAFPELARVYGLYVVPDAEHSWRHWWLVTPDGRIVDPTCPWLPPRDRVAARGGTPLRAPGHYEELARTPTEVGRAV
jgi:hypothetical protein